MRRMSATARPGDPAQLPRILHVVPRMVRRGAEVFAAQLAHALQPGSRNLLFPLFGPGEGLPAAPVRVVPGAGAAGRTEARLGVDPGALGRLRDGLRGLRPDLVVAHGGEPLKYAALADPRGRVPLVYRKISHSAGERGSRAMRALLRRADLILAVSRGLRAELVNEFDVPPERVEIVPTSRVPPPELDAAGQRAVRERIGASPDQPLLAWVGRLSAEKQPHVAVQVLALVRTRFGPCTLALVGAGPLRAAVERAAAAVPQALVLGSRDDAAEIVAASDLVVSTSRTEGAPGALVEAGLAGVPVVAFDVGEVHQVVRDAESGVLVPAGDLDAVAAAVVELLVDHDRRRRLGRRARETCAPFSLDATLPRYAELLAGLLGPKGDPLRGLARPPRLS
jgi:glycosyltransferase involved in cell wall biosynthesis